MHIFQVRDLRFSPINIIADDVQHASMTLLLSLYKGLKHWPGVHYAIGPWVPPEELAPDVLKELADKHCGGFAQFIDNGWEVNQVKVDDLY